jgi:hypothetical protein
MLITPSSWGFQLVRQHRTIDKFSGAVAREKEDFCKGRSLLKLMGAVIYVEIGTMKFTSPLGNHHDFPKGKSKGKRGRRKASSLNASSLENT